MADRSHARVPVRARGPAARVTLVRWFAWLAVAAMAQGCGGGDSTTPSRDLLGDPPVTCANADLSALRKTVFVSTAGSDSPTCGSGAAGACRSVQQGIANCTETACGVLVGQGTYELDAAAAGLPRNVVLRQGVNVFGGCMLGGSTESRYRSTLRGPAGLPAVSASAITGATLMHGFVVIAGSSTAADGTASIAMAVDASPGLTMRSLQLVGGPGARGANGVSTTNFSRDCASSGDAASCSTVPGQPTGPQTGQFVNATWAGGTGGDGGPGTATGQSLPSDHPLCAPGGKGGQHGGASIGLLLSDSALSLDPSVVLVASRGGDGGTGGTPLIADFGGGGAGAAGGNGGPSYGLVANGSASPLPVVNEGVFAGSPGAAGSFGNGGVGREAECFGVNGTAGRAGVSVAAYRVGSNWVTQGQGPKKGVGRISLASGQQLASPQGTYLLTMQSDGNLVFSGNAASWSQGGTLSPGSRLLWDEDSLCVVPSAWCAGGGFAPPHLPKEWGPDAFLAVEEGWITIYNGTGAMLWTAP